MHVIFSLTESCGVLKETSVFCSSNSLKHLYETEAFCTEKIVQNFDSSLLKVSSCYLIQLHTATGLAEAPDFFFLCGASVQQHMQDLSRPLC